MSRRVPVSAAGIVSFGEVNISVGPLVLPKVPLVAAGSAGFAVTVAGPLQAPAIKAIRIITYNFFNPVFFNVVQISSHGLQ